MSTLAHSGSTPTVYSRMTRAASMFSDTLTSFAVGSAITTRSMECGIEGPFSGSPQVVKRCPRLEAEISQVSTIAVRCIWSIVHERTSSANVSTPR